VYSGRRLRLPDWLVAGERGAFAASRQSRGMAAGHEHCCVRHYAHEKCSISHRRRRLSFGSRCAYTLSCFCTALRLFLSSPLPTPLLSASPAFAAFCWCGTVARTPLRAFHYAVTIASGQGLCYCASFPLETCRRHMCCNDSILRFITAVPVVISTRAACSARACRKRAALREDATALTTVSLNGGAIVC